MTNTQGPTSVDLDAKPLIDDTFRAEYQNYSAHAEQLRNEVVSRLCLIFTQNKIRLGLPIEGRVKTLESSHAKVARKALKLGRLLDLTDLVGIRVIVLYCREIEKVRRLVQTHFDVLAQEDTAERLGEAQFGYQSLHLVVQLRKDWLTLPSFDGLGDFKIELQVRTLSQHIWAAASHELQYKKEQNIPLTIQRSINRVSALLETVDLELERVLSERDAYLSTGSPDTSTEPLNVDLICVLLAQYFPRANQAGNDEEYGEILEECTAMNVMTAADLRDLILAHRGKILELEQFQVDSRLKDGEYRGTTEKRTKTRVFYSHTGFAREVLRQQFGDNYNLAMVKLA